PCLARVDARLPRVAHAARADLGVRRVAERPVVLALPDPPDVILIRGCVGAAEQCEAPGAARPADERRVLSIRLQLLAGLSVEIQLLPRRQLIRRFSRVVRQPRLERLDRKIRIARLRSLVAKRRVEPEPVALERSADVDVAIVELMEAVVAVAGDAA